MDNQRLTVSRKIIYEELKKAGSDGSTSVLALMKLIYPLGTLHLVYKSSKSVIYAKIAQINRIIKQKNEKIKSKGGRSGYTLIDLKK